MLMPPLNREHTFHWMLPKRFPPLWSMVCLTRSRFFEVAGGLVEAAAKAGKARASPALRCVENVAPTLWAEGKADAAIRLEQLLNQLGNNLRV